MVGDKGPMVRMRYGILSSSVKRGTNVVVTLNGQMSTSTVVSHKYAPPFATLASVQNAGGAYTRDATISLAITPPLPVPIKHDLIVGGR